MNNQCSMHSCYGEMLWMKVSTNCNMSMVLQLYCPVAGAVNQMTTNDNRAVLKFNALCQNWVHWVFKRKESDFLMARKSYVIWFSKNDLDAEWSKLIQNIHNNSIIL